MIINKVCLLCFELFCVLVTLCDVRSLAKGATWTIFISNATTCGQGGDPAVGRAHCARDGRYAPWGGQGEGEEECRTDTGGSRLLVEVTGHSPGDGAATRVGRGAAIAAAPATQGIRQTVARRLSVGAAGVGRGRVGDWAGRTRPPAGVPGGGRHDEATRRRDGSTERSGVCCVRLSVFSCVCRVVCFLTHRVLSVPATRNVAPNPG